VVFFKLFCRILIRVSTCDWDDCRELTVPAFFSIIAAPPGCSDRKLVTSYAFESSTIQQSFLLLCFAISAPLICDILHMCSKLMLQVIWPTAVEVFEGEQPRQLGNNAPHISARTSASRAGELRPKNTNSYVIRIANSSHFWPAHKASTCVLTIHISILVRCENFVRGFRASMGCRHVRSFACALEALGILLEGSVGSWNVDLSLCWRKLYLNSFSQATSCLLA
jgi:hypothetical protein